MYVLYLIDVITATVDILGHPEVVVNVYKNNGSYLIVT